MRVVLGLPAALFPQSKSRAPVCQQKLTTRVWQDYKEFEQHLAATSLHQGNRSGWHNIETDGPPTFGDAAKKGQPIKANGNTNSSHAHFYRVAPSRIMQAGNAPFVAAAPAAKLAAQLLATTNQTNTEPTTDMLAVTNPLFFLPGKILSVRSPGAGWLMDYMLTFQFNEKWYTMLPYSKARMPLMLKMNTFKGHQPHTAIRDHELIGFCQVSLQTTGGIPTVRINVQHLVDALWRTRHVPRAALELIATGYMTTQGSTHQATERTGDILVRVHSTNPHSNKRKRTGDYQQPHKGGHALHSTNKKPALWLGKTAVLLRQHPATNKITKTWARFRALDTKKAVYTNPTHVINGRPTPNILFPFDLWDPTVRCTFINRTPAQVTASLFAYATTAVGKPLTQTTTLYCMGVLKCTLQAHFADEPVLYTRTGPTIRIYAHHTLPDAKDWLCQAQVAIDPRERNHTTRAVQFAELVRTALAGLPPTHTIELHP